MGLRIRGGRRGTYCDKSSVNSHISARGRRVIFGSRPGNTNGSTCSSENVSASKNIFPNSNALERRKRDEELNQCILKSLDHLKSVTEEEKLTRNIQLELEKTVKDFDVGVLSDKPSCTVEDDMTGNMTLTSLEGSGSQVSMSRIWRQVNGSLSKSLEDVERKSLPIVQPKKNHSGELSRKSASEVQCVDSVSTGNADSDKNFFEDGPNAAKPGFNSVDQQDNSCVKQSTNGPSKFIRNERYTQKNSQRLNQYRIANMGQQKSYKYLNKLSKRNRINFYKMSSDWNPGVNRVSKSLGKDVRITPKADANANCVHNRRQSLEKSPKRYLSSPCSVSSNEIKSCPGTSTGNQVITSRDMSTLPMILRNSVMTQNSDSEKDDDEDMTESSVARNKTGGNEVVDVIDGIEFVTFENEHDMVQFTRLVSDESGRGDLSDLGFSTEFPEAIIPKKTKDIKKIKGWQKKKFTVTQNPMLDLSASGPEPPALNDLCPDSIEDEHNYMRRQLENEEEYTDCEDELPGLSMGISSFSVVPRDAIKMKEGLTDQNKEEKISVWKPSEKSAFVSFSSANSDRFGTSKKKEKTDCNGESVDACIDQMKDPQKPNTDGHSEQQSQMDHPSIRSMVTLSPTSILMNKIRKQKALLKAKIIKHDKSVQADLPDCEVSANLKRRNLPQRISEDELREWSQPFQDIWHVDEKRALFAVSAVKPLSFLRGKHLTPFKNRRPDGSLAKLRYKRKKRSHQASAELLSQRRLLRSSTKKNTPPARLTRSSINASQVEIPGRPESYILKYSYHRKPVDTPDSENESVNSVMSSSKKQPSGGTASSLSATQLSQGPLAKSCSSKKAVLSPPPLDQPVDETHLDNVPLSASSQVLVSSSSKTLDSPISNVVKEKEIQGPECISVVSQPSSNCSSQELNRTSRHEYRRSRKSRRKLIARKIWLIRRMRKLKELGILGSNLKGPLPSVADLGVEELRKLSHLENYKIRNGIVQPLMPACDRDEDVDKRMAGEEYVEGKKSLPGIENIQKSNSDGLDSESIGHKIISPVSSDGKVRHGLSGKEFSPEMENEELKVFLKPKPRLQVEALSPIKTSHDSSMYVTSSSSKGEASYPFELSPPRKTEVEIIKSKSPNSPALARKRLIRELQKLNANFVSVDPTERNITKDNCSKEFCRLGCVCDSIKTDKRLIEHCGKVECMFSCVCPSSECSASSAKHLIIGSDTVNRLQEESSRHMAKVERDFHHTVVEAAGELVLPGRQQRERRLPKRFLDESIDPDALFISKKPKSVDLLSKVTGSQTKKASNSQSTPQYKKCSVSLGQFPNLQASVRCIYHSRLNCPCLHFRTSNGVPRNVAMKSTSKVREKQMSASRGSAFSITMRDIGILAQCVPKKPQSSTLSSFLGIPDSMSSAGVISEVQSIIIDKNVAEEEMKGKDVSQQSNVVKGSKSSCEKKVINKEPQNEGTSDVTPDKDCYCRDIASDLFSEGGEHLHSVRTSGIDLWVSRLPLDKRVRQGGNKVKDLSSKIPALNEEEPLTMLCFAESDPKDVPCLDDDVPKNSSSVCESETKAAPRGEDVAPEVAVLVEDDSLKAIPQVPLENSSSGADLSELVRQDDSMPLFKIVEVKSLPPSSFESDSVAPTESDEKDITCETETVASSESCDNSKFHTSMPVGVIQKKAGNRNGKAFKTLESFNSWVKSNETMCGDLEKMCSKSLKPLPINSVILVRWPWLSKLVECHSAHLWIRQRFSSNPGQNSHVFVTQKDRPPDLACVNFLDLERKEALCAKVAIMLKAAKLKDPKAMGCAILVSKGCFWEISGHIKFGKVMKKNLPNNERVGVNNSSIVIHKLVNEEASVPANAVSEVDNPDGKVHLSTSDMPQLLEVSGSGSSSILSSPVDSNTLSQEGDRNSEVPSDPGLESSVADISVVKVEHNWETSMLSAVDVESGPCKNLNPKSTFDSDTVDYDFGKYSIKDRTGNTAVAGNEPLSHKPGSHILAKCRSGAAERRRSPILLTDSLINLERIPGTLSGAFLKHKQISKVGQGNQSPPPTSSGSGLAKYSAIESIPSTPNPFNLGLFSQGLEPPSVILQSEDSEPIVLDQQELKVSAIVSPEKREERLSKRSLFGNKKDASPPCKASLNLKKTPNLSSVVLENVNSIHESKNLSSVSDTEKIGLPMSSVRPGTSFAGVKPPVLIIDLNKLRQGQTIPSIKNKNNPLSIKVTEIKSLAQGFDNNAWVDTYDKNSPKGGINSISPMKGSSLPAILPTGQQNPGSQEKVLISKTLPKPFSVCKDPVVVTCPKMSLPGGVNMSSGPIHVSIIQDVNQTGKMRRKSTSSDSGSLLHVTENGERQIISEKTDTQKIYPRKKIMPPNAEPRLVKQGENCNVDHYSSSKNGVPLIINADDDTKGNNGSSSSKLNIDFISVPATQLAPNGSWPKEVTVSVDRNEVSLVSCNIPKDTNGTPVKEDESTTLQDLPKSSVEIRGTQKVSKNIPHRKKIKSSSGPSEPSGPLSPSMRGITICEEIKEQGNITAQGTLSDVPNPSQEDVHSTIKSQPEVEAKRLTVREDLLSANIGEVGEMVGSTGLNSKSQEETVALKSGEVTAHSPVKSSPVASRISKPLKSKSGLKITQKQSGFSEETKSGTIGMPSTSSSVSKIRSDKISELDMSPEKEAIHVTHSRFHNTSKSVPPITNPEDHSSLCSIKEKFDQLLQHSTSSSCGTSPLKAQSPKKASTHLTKKALTLSAEKGDHFSPQNASTQLKKKDSISSADKDSHLSSWKASPQLIGNSITPSAEKGFHLSPRKASTRWTKNALNPSAGKDFSLSPKKGSPQKIDLIPSSEKDFTLSPSKDLTVSSEAITKPVEKACSWYPKNASSDSTKSLKINLEAPDTLASPSPAEESVVSDPSFVVEDEDALSHDVHHSPPSHGASRSEMQPQKKEPSISVMVRARTPNKDSNSSTSREKGDLEYHSCLSSCKNHSEDCKSPSPIEKAVHPNVPDAVKEKCLRVTLQQQSSQGTSMTETQPTPSALTPVSADTTPPGSESSGPPSLSSVVPSSEKGKESSTDNDVIWYRLELNGEFDKLIAEETGFSTSSSKLISAVMIARTSNRTVRLAFDKRKNSEESQEFKKGIYAVPTVSGSYVKIGPYMRNEPTGVKTLKKLGNHTYKIVPNLLKVENATQEVHGMLKSGGDEPEKSLAPVREEKKQDNLNMLADNSPKNSEKISSEELSPEKNHSNVPLKIPVLSLPRISVNMEKKVHNAIDEEKKLMKGMSPTKGWSIGDSDSNAPLMCAKSDDLKKKKCKTSGKSNVKDKVDISPVVLSAKRLVKGQESTNSLVIKEDSMSGKLSKTSDAKLDSASSDESSIISGIGHNQGSAPTSQVMENIESNDECLKENMSLDAAEEGVAPQNDETSDNDECPKNEKMEMNPARESSTSSPSDTERTSMRGVESGERKRVASRGDEKRDTPTEKSSEEQLVILVSSMTEEEFNTLPEEQYESGYLVPSIPKLAPIPAKKCLLPTESQFFVIEDLGQPGSYTTVEGVDKISSYINRLLHRHIRFFPADFKIHWTYFKNLPSAPAPGSVELKKLSKDMFITYKGVFRYALEAETNSKQEKLLFTSPEVNPVVQLVKEIEEAKAQLLSLMVPHGDVTRINCEKAIKKALGEISTLQSQNENLSQSNVVEKRRNQYLEDKCKALLKALGVETFSEFKETQVSASSEEEPKQKNETDKTPEDLGARGRSCRRVRGKGVRKLEKTEETGSAENVNFSGSETESSPVKEESSKGRVLRSSKSSNPSLVPPEKSDESDPGKCLSRTSSACAEGVSAVKESIPEEGNFASPNTAEKLISPAADLNGDNKSDSGCSEIKDSASASCSSDRMGSQGEKSSDELTQASSVEGKTVDASLWRKSFSQVKLNRGSRRSGDSISSIENPTLKRQNSRKKGEPKLRASPRCAEASSSALNPQPTNPLSKKRKS